MAIVDKALLQFIENKMDTVFDKRILERGKLLYEQEAIFSYEQIGKDRIKGLVQGGQIYSTKINLDLEDDYMICVCSCKYKYDCKHAVALAYKVLQEKDRNLEVITKRNESINKLNKAFGKEAANVYRVLPNLDVLTLREVVKYLSTRKDRYHYNEIEIWFKDEQTLEVESNYLDWRGRPEKSQAAKILIKIDGKDLKIKCLSCDKMSNKLCEHQQLILSNEMVQARATALYDGSLSYLDLIDQYNQRVGMDRLGTQEYFNLMLDDKFAYLKPKSQDLILDTSSYEGLNDYLSSQQNLDKDGLLKQKELDHEIGNALVWREDETLTLVKGKFHKSKTYLSSHIEEEDFPSAFPKEQFTLYIDLLKSLDFSEGTLFLLKENVLVLSEIVNYYSLEKKGYNYKIRKKDLYHFVFSQDYVNVATTVVKDKYINSLELRLIVDQESIKPSQVDWYNEYFIVYQKKGYLFDNPEIIDLLHTFNFRDQIQLLQNDDEVFYKLLNKVKQLGPVTMENVEDIYLTGGKRQLHIREVGKHLIFEPTLLYDEHRYSIYDKPDYLVPESNQRLHGDIESFNSYVEIIKALHPQWDRDHVPQKYMYLHIDDVLNNLWFLEFFETSKTNNIEVFGQDSLNNLKFNANRVSITSHITSGIDWFKADVKMAFGDQQVSQKDWIEAIKNNEKFIQLSDGSLGVLPEEWLNKLKKIAAVSTIEGDELNISKLKFNIIDQLFDNIDDTDLLLDLKRKKEALANYDSDKKYTLPKNITAQLRPYQVEGFQWLKFLDDFEFGGCLADDMGLGKTLQVLCLLADQKEIQNGTSLAVIPRSLLFNWAAEIEKFAPHLTFLIHHGPNRDKTIHNYEKFDLLISTYDTVSRDIEVFKEIKFNYVILDESQAIKNPRSQRFKAMKLLQSRNKIAMTGTPIENNTFDLYAQFSFLNPGIFGSQKSFRDNFSIPIDVLGDTDALGTLKSIIHPFILRRTKENVAKELPDKTESIIYCEMGDEQRKLYEALRKKIKEDINNKVEEDGVNNSKFMILEGLLRLRQLCNAPELVDANLPPKKKTSVKVETLIGQLTEDLGNHKALVFSQFVGMLGIIRKALDEKGIKYAYLDGSTRDRQGAVEQFMEDDDCHIFLISIKAGNTGLNLTKADYVYIVDPWWNPAVEAQAIDRTHRIGQTNNIFAYRMICKDTIEEKIVELQKKKRKLAKDLIQVDESVFKSLDKGELLALFD